MRLDSRASSPPPPISNTKMIERRCKPKKCRQECKKSCPVVKIGEGRNCPSGGFYLSSRKAHVTRPSPHANRQALYRGQSGVKDCNTLRGAVHRLRYLRQGGGSRMGKAGQRMNGFGGCHVMSADAVSICPHPSTTLAPAHHFACRNALLMPL